MIKHLPIYRISHFLSSVTNWLSDRVSGLKMKGFSKFRSALLITGCMPDKITEHPTLLTTDSPSVNIFAIARNYVMYFSMDTPGLEKWISSFETSIYDYHHCTRLVLK